MKFHSITREDLETLKHSAASAHLFLKSRRIRGWPTVIHNPATHTSPASIKLVENIPHETRN